jgi:hypothetical protein
MKSQSRPNKLGIPQPSLPAFGVRSESEIRDSSRFSVTKADSTQALPPRPTRSAPVFDQLQGQRPNEPPWLPQSRWASGTRSKRRRWAGTCPALRGWSRRPNACTVPVSAAAPARTHSSKNLRISLALSTRIARRRSTLQIPQRLYQKKQDKRKRSGHGGVEGAGWPVQRRESCWSCFRFRKGQPQMQHDQSNHTEPLGSAIPGCAAGAQQIPSAWRAIAATWAGPRVLDIHSPGAHSRGGGGGKQSAFC